MGQGDRPLFALPLTRAPGNHAAVVEDGVWYGHHLTTRQLRHGAPPRVGSGIFPGLLFVSGQINSPRSPRPGREEPPAEAEWHGHLESRGDPKAIQRWAMPRPLHRLPGPAMTRSSSQSGFAIRSWRPADTEVFFCQVPHLERLRAGFYGLFRPWVAPIFARPFGPCSERERAARIGATTVGRACLLPV